MCAVRLSAQYFFGKFRKFPRQVPDRLQAEGRGRASIAIYGKGIAFASNSIARDHIGALPRFLGKLSFYFRFVMQISVFVRQAKSTRLR